MKLKLGILSIILIISTSLTVGTSINSPSNLNANEEMFLTQHSFDDGELSKLVEVNTEESFSEFQFNLTFNSEDITVTGFEESPYFEDLEAQQGEDWFYLRQENKSAEGEGENVLAVINFETKTSQGAIEIDFVSEESYIEVDGETQDLNTVGTTVNVVSRGDIILLAEEAEQFDQLRDQQLQMLEMALENTDEIEETAQEEINPQIQEMIPERVKPILPANDQININVNNLSLAVETQELNVTSVQNEPFENPTLALHTDVETITYIMESDNPPLTLREEYHGDGINLEANTFANRLRISMINNLSRTYGLAERFGLVDKAIEEIE